MTTCDQLQQQLAQRLAQQQAFWNSYTSAYQKTLVDQIGCVVSDTIEPLTDPGPPAMTGGVPFSAAQAQARLNQLRSINPQTDALTQLEAKYIQVLNDLVEQDRYFSLWLSAASDIAVVRRLMSQYNCGTAIAQ